MLCVILLRLRRRFGRMEFPKGIRASLDLLALPGTSLGLLGSLGAFWSFLVPSGAFWGLLGYAGATWSFLILLGSPGVSWALLGIPSGFLGPPSRFLEFLVPSRAFWVSLHQEYGIWKSRVFECLCGCFVVELRLMTILCRQIWEIRRTTKPHANATIVPTEDVRAENRVLWHLKRHKYPD